MFVLVGITNGDDLIASQRINVKVSPSKEALQELAAKMERERDEWLRTHQSFMETAYGVIYYPSIWNHFEVEEVPEVSA